MGGILITASGFGKLEAELDRLQAERERAVDRIKHALALGGAAPENGDYLDARHEQELLDRRISLLEDRLRTVEVVDPLPDGEVDVGERVSVLDLTNGATTDYRIVGAGEGDPAAGEISYESPIGSALLGRCVGDVVEVSVPTGLVRLEIVEVDG